MSERTWIHWLEDMAEAIQDVIGYTKDLDFTAFERDRRTLHAVIYCFIVIGEAERHIPKEVKDRYPEVPWDKMRGMRNFLIHEYPWLSPRIVWETAVNDLPPLLTRLHRILEVEKTQGDESCP